MAQFPGEFVILRIGSKKAVLRRRSYVVRVTERQNGVARRALEPNPENLNTRRQGRTLVRLFLSGELIHE